MALFTATNSFGIKQGQRMATKITVKTGSKWCDLIQQEMDFIEERVYPADVLPDNVGFQVRGCRCSLAVDCNLADVPCKWAFTNPATDQYFVR